MPISEDTVREALKQVVDPELFVNIIDLGLVYTVTVNEAAEGKSDVAIEMTMTSPACPAGPQLIQNSKDAIGRIDGCLWCGHRLGGKAGGTATPQGKSSGR